MEDVSLETVLAFEENPLTASRNIPSSIKRKVRRACGFGCALCGHPIFEYDHIVPFSQVKSHTVENLCCLCPTHHAEKTRKIIATELVSKARMNPINVQTKNSKSHPLYFFGDYCLVEVGSIKNYVFKPSRAVKPAIYSPLVIRNEELIKITFGNDEIILIDILVKNELDEIIIKIVENELLFKADSWDIEFIANKLKVVEQKGDTALEMVLNAPYGVSIVKGELWNLGSFLKIEDGNVFTKSFNGASGAELYNSRYGIVYNSREDFAPSGLFFLD